MNLQGKSALVTGGRRVGGELAIKLARRGMNVALTYRSNRSAVEQTVSSIEALGANAIAIEADLSHAAEAENAVAETVAAWGRIDVLVAMASVFQRTPFDTLEPADFDRMIAGNLTTAYHAAIASARSMILPKQDEEIAGKIVFVGDWASDRPYKHYLPYLVAKGALKTLTAALARELAPRIHVNLVQPAMIAPPVDYTKTELAAIVAKTPLERHGTPDDLNNFILYLLEGTDFATGSWFRVDGGRFVGLDDDDV
jgi:pteridine reductase